MYYICRLSIYIYTIYKIDIIYIISIIVHFKRYDKIKSSIIKAHVIITIRYHYVSMYIYISLYIIIYHDIYKYYTYMNDYYHISEYTRTIS